MSNTFAPIVSLAHGLSLIRAHQADGALPYAYIKGQRVLLQRDVLETFAAHGTRCRGCGIEATHFRLDPAQAHPTATRYKHLLHLYGEREGTLVLFTQDHTLARSLGGTDDLHNRAPMCLDCNQAKAQAERELAMERSAKARAAAATPSRPMPKIKPKAKPAARPLAWKGKAHKRSFEPLRAWRQAGSHRPVDERSGWAD